MAWHSSSLTDASLTGRTRTWLYLLALLASLNLVLGLALSFGQTARAGDLWTVYSWCHQWLYRGVSLYGPDGSTDYPPNAIVMYSPLAAIPKQWLIAV